MRRDVEIPNDRLAPGSKVGAGQKLFARVPERESGPRTKIMVDSDKLPAVEALARQLQAVSASGWMNVQTPVRQGLEAVVTTANELAEQLAASRGDTKRLEARLEGMEEMVRTWLVMTEELEPSVCVLLSIHDVVMS